MKKLIAGIVTDSRAPGEAKDSEGSAVFQLYQAFASKEETAAFAQAFADGIGWGDAKQRLFERIDAEVAPMREKYAALMAKPGEIEAILRDGAARLRAVQTGHGNGLETEIIAGLREGEQVIVYPGDKIADGVSARVIEVAPH